MKIHRWFFPVFPYYSFLTASLFLYYSLFLQFCLRQLTSCQFKMKHIVIAIIIIMHNNLSHRWKSIHLNSQNQHQKYSQNVGIIIVHNININNKITLIEQSHSHKSGDLLFLNFCWHIRRRPTVNPAESSTGWLSS